MDFQELKDIIPKDDGKIIIVEDGKPQLVVMSFDEYRAKIKGKPAQPANISKVAAGAADPPASSGARFGGQPVLQDEGRGDLTIDDLPLV